MRALLATLDAEGWLFLTGRSKEVINRGGEIVAPAEVENVLLKHGAIAEAVAFAAPHAQLGECVATCITVRASAAPFIRGTANLLKPFESCSPQWTSQLYKKPPLPGADSVPIEVMVARNDCW